MNDQITDAEASGMTAEQYHGRKVFEATIRGASALIQRGMPPGAVIAGLLGVAVQLGTAYFGANETRRLLISAADANSEEAFMPTAH